MDTALTRANVGVGVLGMHGLGLGFNRFIGFGQCFILVRSVDLLDFLCSSPYYALDLDLSYMFVTYWKLPWVGIVATESLHVTLPQEP